MKPLRSLAVAVLLLYALPVAAQDVPKGVNYKPTSDALNSLAKTRLEQALANPEKVPMDLFNDAVVCGPMLWKSLKPSADRVMLESKTVNIVIPMPEPEPIQSQGKRVLTPGERESFWRTLLARYPGLKNGILRKGNAEEISYYWATIPFDIEEPFFVIVAGSDRFVVHFIVEGGKPRLFWIDLVGDLRSLKQ